MKILSLVLVLAGFVGITYGSASGSAAITYAGGNGSSMKEAILMQGAKDDASATRAEYVYLGQHFPHFKLIRQLLLNDGAKVYDLLDFTDSSGAERKIYFDITATF